MSFFASALRTIYKLSGVKKAFCLPAEDMLRVVQRQNRHRGFFLPTDRKAYYEKREIDGFPCLVVRENPTPARRAILFFFGGGMVIGPDKGDAVVLRKLCFQTHSDVWFPCYPLCTEHCITTSYAMAYACYRQMTELYGDAVSTCGFSSGGALALGMAAHNSALGRPLPQPKHIVAISPGEIPWNAAEKARMLALNEKDVAVDCRGFAALEAFMRHGNPDVPVYMLAPSRGDYSGVGGIHFFYSEDEVLYGALPEYSAACRRADVPFTVSARPGMVHCYCMLPYYREAKEDFAKIVDILKQ